MEAAVRAHGGQVAGVQPAFGVDGASRGTFLLAFTMGAIAALLAGACVAPVVLQVVVFSSNLYATGTGAALAMPDPSSRPQALLAVLADVQIGRTLGHLALALVHSSVHFRKRNIFVLDNFLNRA